MTNNKSKSSSKLWQLELANKNMELEISARKQIERSLKDREDRFKTIYKYAPVTYFLCNLSGDFLDGNLEAFNLTGYTTEELFGKNFIDLKLIDKRDQNNILDIISRCGKGENTGPDEFSITKKDGSKVIIEMSTSPVTILEQKQILGIAHDITIQKLAQSQLEESEERFRKLFNSAHDALMTLNPPTWKFTSGNPAILEMFDVNNVKEFLTYGPWDISPKRQPDGRLSSEKAKEMIEIAMTKGSNYFEWTHKKVTGESFPATVILTKIQLKDEAILQATVRDITEQKQSENINKVLFDISNAVNTTNNLNDLYRYIHELLNNIIDVNNIFIAIVDTKNRTLHFPYHVDTTDDDFSMITNFDTSNSLTGLVVSQKKPVLLKKEELEDRAIKNGIWGPTPKIWMGAPLIIKNEVIGVIATQSYINGNLFNRKDLRILSAVSDQVAIAIDRKRSEEALRESEKKYRDLFEKSKDAVLIIHNEKFVDCNQATINMLKYKNKDEFLNTHPSELSPEIQPDGRLSSDKAEEMMRTALQKGSHRFEWDHKQSDGEIFPVEVLLTAISTNKENRIIHTVWRDITVRKQADFELRQSEERFKRLFDDLGDAVFVTKLGGKNRGQILEVNRAAVLQTGYKRKDLLKMNIVKDIYISGSGELKADDWEERLSKGEIVKTTEKKQKQDGTEYWSEVIVTSIKFKGESAGLSISHDITERKRIASTIEVQKQKLMDILEGTNAGTWDWNIQTGEASFDERWAGIMGYTLNELGPTDINTWVNNVHPEDLPKANALLDKHFSGKVDYYDIEFRQPHKDGHWVWVNARGKVVQWDKDGKPLQMSGTHLDITERKQTEEALKVNEEKYHSLAENLPLGIYRNTPGAKGKFIELNQASIDMFGFKDRKSMMDAPVSSLYVSPETRQKFSDKLAKQGFVKNEELRLRRKDGSTFIASSTAIAVKDKNGKIIHYDGIIEDITERAELGMKLLENEEKFRTIVSNSPCVIMQADRHGVISFINYKYSGQEPANIIGKTIYDFMPSEFHDVARNTIRKVFEEGNSYSFENLGLSTDESVIWYKNTVSSIQKKGKVIAVAILAVDISEEKQSDIMKTEFISSISHELRTPLTIIRESLSILSDELFGKLNKYQADIVNPCIDDVDRLGRIINNLLDISRMEGQKIEIERDIIDIVKLAQSVISSFKNKAVNKEIELVLTSNRESIVLYLDNDRIIQVFMNLIGNALKFTEVGKIEVSITEKKDIVECCIVDTGRGISKKDMGTLFDRFHQVGKVMRAGEKGSGLGLSISKGIVKLHKGKIWVNSKIDKGSKFCFSLPKYNTEKIIIEHIEKSIDVAEKAHKKMSLLLIRLSNYPDIESKMGVNNADKVIKLILKIIQDELAPGEFSFIKERNEVILFSDITKQNISILSSRLEGILSESVLKINKSIKIELLVGYSIFPNDAKKVSDLISIANKSFKK